MTTISAADVNKLRQLTGAGMMDCKKALTESNGDIDAAIDNLRKKGQKVSAARADREAKEGAVIAKTTADKKTGVIIQLTSETDFVSRNEDFIKFANSIADLALANKPASAEALKSLTFEGSTLAEKLIEQVGKIGEKIDVVKYELIEGENVVAYIHGANRLGVLVSLNNPVSDANAIAGKDVAMQIAAMNPLAIDESTIDPATIAREKDIAIEQIKAEGKPAEMAEKIALGKVNKFLKDNTLLAQPFVKDNAKSVGDYLKATSANLKLTAFKRVALG